jgi:type III secretion protein U
VADSDKTEKPTPKRLRDARKKGQVAKSAELTSAASFTFMLGLLCVAGGSMADALQALIRRSLRDAFAADAGAAWPGYLHAMAATSLLIIVPLFAAVGLVAALACRLQVGSIFSFEPVMPKLERVDPMAGLKRIFSKKTLSTFATTLVKTLLIASVVYACARHAVPDMLKLVHVPSAQLGAAAGSMLLSLFGFAAAIYAATSVVDLVLQRHWYVEDMKMAKHEVRREYKEQEGDPQLKGQRKQMAMELAFSEVESEVQKASVVVMNPTHLAVALAYRPGEVDLPKVVAKGRDDRAALIRRAAEKHGIPVVRDVPLARALFEKTPVDHHISRELFQPVAKLLLWVRDLEAQARGER